MCDVRKRIKNRPSQDLSAARTHGNYIVP
jgi:hypothetical protein